MHRIAILITLCIIVFTGCHRTAKGPKEGALVPRPDNPPVAYLAENDPRVQEASRQAQQTLETFVKNLDEPKATQTSLAIKTTLQEQNGPAEGIWITSLRYDGKVFRGTVSNEPVHLKNVYLGSHISVESDKVADWMIVENGKLHGGYTLRVLRETLKGEDRQKFEQSLPFKFE